MAAPQPRRSQSRNGRTALVLVGLVAGMVGLSFASVPLYRLFCQITGFGGTTRVAEALPEQPGERIVTIRFNSDIHPDLPWAFQPAQRAIELRVGESGLAFYKARNLAERATTGVSTFNVTPQKAGPYFNKVQCFCFEEQTLQPGEEMEMGVSFFVDPAIEDDPNLADVRTITLSYTFLRSLDDLPDEAGPDEDGQLSSAAPDPGAERVN